jgi:hypothetical protein
LTAAILLLSGAVVFCSVAVAGLVTLAAMLTGVDFS